MSAFPTSPVDGQVYTINNRSWTYNSSQYGWILNKNGPTGPAGNQGPTGPAGVLLTTISVQNFVSNGNVSSFSLNFTPVNANNIIVNVDGLIQTPNVNYTVNNNILTFNSTPVNGSSIDVMNLPTGSPIPGPTGPAGASTVSAPTTSKGQLGDKIGMIAVNPSYIFWCTGNYDGITDIWRRVVNDGTTW